MVNVNLDAESPFRYEKKSNKIVIETDKIPPNSCKVVDVGNLFNKKKSLNLCMEKFKEHHNKTSKINIK